MTFSSGEKFPQNSVEKADNNVIRKILENLEDHYEGVVREFLESRHEYGLQLKVKGNKKATIIKDSFNNLDCRVKHYKKPTYKEKKAQVHHISVMAREHLGV